MTTPAASDSSSPASGPGQAPRPDARPAERARRRNLAIVGGGVIVVVILLGWLISSEAPQRAPIDITAPFQYLPADTATVMYLSGKELWGKRRDSTADADAQADPGGEPNSSPSSSGVPADDPDALFERRSDAPPMDPALTLLDYIRNFRDVEHVLIAVPRGGGMPAFVAAPIRQPDGLIQNLMKLPGFSASRSIEDSQSDVTIHQLRFVWTKLLYLSSAEDQYLFAGDGSYFLKTLRGFRRPEPAASLTGGAAAPLLKPYRPGTILSVVRVMSGEEDIEARMNLMKSRQDPDTIAIVQSWKEISAALRNLTAVRLDVWRRPEGQDMIVQADLLFADPEFSRAFQQNVVQARSVLSVLGGTLLPRDVGAAFGRMVAAFASPVVQERLVTLTIEDSPARVQEFLSALDEWLDGLISLSPPLPSPS
ncbi:MAG: hypothetical protein Kow0059_00340 [Candidatus Sumerlaeia bacterium]